MTLFSTESYYKVDGKGGIAIFGDTHWSAIFKGEHIDYQAENLEAMEKMVAIVEKESPTAVVLLGDIIGVSERSIRDKRFLVHVTKWLQDLNRLVDGNVYVVRGNHDIGDFPDFEYFKSIGLIKTPTELDYFVDGELMVRYHFVGYGEERRPLRYVGLEEGVHQVVLGHNDYTITGVTNWYYSKGGIELSSLHNFKNVDMVISGHIHHPSPEIYSQLVAGNEVGLYYTGAVSRVSKSEQYMDCNYFMFYYNSEEEVIDYESKPFGLRPPSEVFDMKALEGAIVSLSEEEVERAERSKRLTDILNEAMEFRIHTGNLVEQIERMPQATAEVKALAKGYLQEAINSL